MLKRILSLFMVVVFIFMPLNFVGFSGMQTVSAASNTYYVSRTGDDVVGDGSIDNPWKTIQKAADIMVAGDTCLIREGTYRESITPLNSGTNGNPIKYQAYPGETVTVSGADLITGWEQETGAIYKAPMSWTLGGRNQIFVDGQMMNEARWPNTSLDLLNPTNAVVVSGAATSITDPNLKSLGFDLTGASVWNSVGHAWTAQTGKITSFDALTGTINFNAFNVTGGFEGFYNPKPGAAYYVFGKRELLDTSTEWFYDQANSSLKLWAPGGVDPSLHVVEAKKRAIAFNLDILNYIEISGINIFASTVTMLGSSNCKLIKVEAKYVSHFTELIDYTQDYLTSGIQISGKNNEIRNSTIAYSAGNGIMISGGSNNRIINSLIHDVDYSGSNDSGVVLTGENNALSHSTVRNVGRAAVMPGGMKGGVIQYNNLYNSGMLTDDVGTIYEWQGDGQNAEIHHNYIHDNKAKDYAVGIYLDNGSSNYHIHHNVIWNNAFHGILINRTNNLTQVYNNTLHNLSDIAGFVPDDLYGTKVFNNIITDELPADSNVFIGNSHVDIGSNLEPGNDPEFVDAETYDFHLSADSPAIDAGRVIAGITDGYVGTAPDIGAYEFGGEDWTAGHNFDNPPNPTFTMSDTPYTNKVKNAGFEQTDYITNISVDAYFSLDEPVVDLKFYTSADGVNFKDFSPIKTILGGDRNHINYSSSALSHARFLKIEFKETSIPAGNPSLGNVEIGYGRGDTVLDDLNDFTKMRAFTNNLTFESSTPNLFNGDTSRLVRSDSAKAHIVYSASEYSLESWTKTHSQGSTVIEELENARTGGNSVRIGSEEDGIEQTVSGLSPNTEYTFSGWAKTSGWVKDEEVRLGVKEYGGPDKYVAITSTEWKRGTVTFTTGANNSSAKIYLYKPAVAVEESDTPTGSIDDELNDFSKIFTHSSGMYFDTSNPQTFHGDSSRIIRANPTKDTVSYRVPGHMTSMLVDTYFLKGSPIEDFNFYTSNDGITYNAFIPNRTDTDGDFIRVQYSSSSFPMDTTHLKIEFGGTTSPTWNPNLGGVHIDYIKGDNPNMYSFSHGDDFSVIESSHEPVNVLVDELDDFTKMESHTSSMNLDTSNPQYYNGDSSRIIRSSVNKEHIIYKTTGSMTSLLVDTYFSDAYPIADFNFYTSSDGITYNPFNPTKTDLGGIVTRIQYDSTFLPLNTRYLKVEFGGTTGPAWNPNISRIEIGYDNAPVIIPVTGITLNKTEAIINTGETTKLTAIIAPANATNKALTWSSSNPAVAEVDSNGNVTGVNAGTATITVTTEDGDYSVDCVITVTESAVPGTIIDELNDYTKMFSHTSNMNFDSSYPEFYNGDTSRIIRGTATNEQIIYKTPSNMTSMLIESFFANVFPIADFNFYTSSDGITYNPFNPTKTDMGGEYNRIQYDSSELPLGTRYLKVEFGGTTGPAWNPNLSRVVIGYGNVPVTIPVTGVNLDRTAASIDTGETTTLTATIAPADATNKPVTWNSSNPAVAAVDSNGLVTGVGAGTATITVTTVDGNYTEDCVVTVHEAVGTIVDELNDFTKMFSHTGSMYFDTSAADNFNGDPSRIIRGSATKEQIIYKTPSDMTSMLVDTYFESSLPITDFNFYTSSDGITYHSFNPTKTDMGGYWTRIQYDSSALPLGTRYLKVEFGGTTAPAWNPNLSRIEIGYGNAATVTVPVTGVILDKTEAIIVTGETTLLTATVSPVEATNKAVTWSSSNTAVAAVDSNGLVTGVDVGTATITVTTADGFKTIVCTVQVVMELEKVTLTVDKAFLISGNLASLLVIGAASNESEMDLSQAQIIFTSDNEDVAIVDGNGSVTAIGEGIVNITAAVTLHGITKADSIQIKVDNTSPITTVQIDGIEKNGSYLSDATITLSAADNLSGVDRSEYRITDSGDWLTYTGLVIITQKGTYTVQYRSIDRAGNVELYKTSVIKLVHSLDSGTGSGTVTTTPIATSAPTPTPTSTLIPTLDLGMATTLISGVDAAIIDVISNVPTGQDTQTTGREATKIVKDLIEAVSVINLSNSVHVTGDTVRLDMDTSQLTSLLAIVKDNAAILNARLLTLLPKSAPAKVTVTLDLGSQTANIADIMINTDLIQGVKAAGIDAISFKVNGIALTVDIDQFVGSTRLTIEKLPVSTATNATLLKIASDVYSFEFLDASNNQVSFTTPVMIKFPIANVEGINTDLLVIAKVIDGKLEYYGGEYNAATKIFEAERKSFSTYAVVENKVSFIDIASVEAWAGKDIGIVAAKGIVQGRGNDSFVPRANVTRAEFATMIVKAFHLEDETATLTFNDVKPNDWFSAAIAAAAKAGIINGRTMDTFAPNATITRAEMATIAARALELVKGYKKTEDSSLTLMKFKDANTINDTLIEGVASALSYGIIVGFNNNFNPNGSATRAEATVVISRLLTK